MRKRKSEGLFRKDQVSTTARKKTVAGKTNTAEQAQGNGGGGNTKRHLGSLEEKDTWVDSPVGMKGFHGKDGYRTYNMAC